ncbi:alpha/beta fold hydrolase [Antricoccus suffuscus]|uniref:alpha/beta fold hydrolase n=1 Tax=Antricoccus suffuscus TaxID=1629062 RepID=UPI00192E2C7E|nr:alpha/beta hydrolase [Antricoccus suffuscus]
MHGFPQGAQSYREVARILAARGARVIVPDQRGYSAGARPIGVEHYTQATLAADVVAIMDAMGLDKVHLVGHDWGSNIAWVAAASYPERFSALTAVSIPHPSAFGEAYKIDSDQKKRSEYFKLFWQEGKAEQVLLEDDAKWLRDVLADIGPERAGHYIERLQQPGALTAALNYYRAMSSANVATPSVIVPTTLVWSDNDTAVGPVGPQLCAKYVDADYKLITLNGISHWIPELAPQDLADAIAERF